ncbi:MAG: RNA 2',3'-cyclic phosphodiesterase [Pseudomonadota bacterium]
MPRLFVALSIPDVVADALLDLQSGVDGARWRTVDHFHTTLAFLGQTDGHGLDSALEALAALDASSFDLRLSGVGAFGDKKPRALWAGVEPDDALLHLQAKVSIALRNAGFDLERRRYMPHVTLAYLKGVRPEAVAQWSSRSGLFTAGPFSVNAFHLYSSQLGAQASHYELEASYALSSSK